MKNTILFLTVYALNRLLNQLKLSMEHYWFILVMIRLKFNSQSKNITIKLVNEWNLGQLLSIAEVIRRIKFGWAAIRKIEKCIQRKTSLTSKNKSTRSSAQKMERIMLGLRLRDRKSNEYSWNKTRVGLGKKNWKP